MTKVLIVNSGSSSLKLEVVELAPDAEASLGRIEIERIGGNARLEIAVGAQSPVSRETGAKDIATATDSALDAAQSAGLLDGIDAVGHRVVHGGMDFRRATLLDDAVLARIEALGRLAPLHNPPALEAIRVARSRLSSIPHVAAFDTSFYVDMPPVAATYAIPGEIAREHGIRRYGFHGIAHRYMIEQFTKAYRTLESPRLVSFQLGGGCSATASAGGIPIDTSMGFSPLEGLVMATRSGDLDPSLPAFIAEAEGISAAEIDTLLNRRSGLLGLSGLSGDMRDLLEAERTGDERAGLAVDLFCYRARKYLGAYAAALGGLDGVIFGGGIGENSAEVRSRICQGMAWAGIHMNEAANHEAVSEGWASIGNTGSVPILVVRVREAIVIAREVLSVLSER